MSAPDRIEFYRESGGWIVSVQSSMVPPVGSMISIRGVTWKVDFVSYALDHADEPRERGMRANVTLSRVVA